ncbi:MAG: hypothetical protein IJU52_05270 [Clostridia bacterium]|nr:hypothetical protein [Clostridia bacterium]
MEEQNKPNFRGGEDERYCGAYRIFSEDRSQERSEDFILPDYLPDVKKIAAVFPETAIKGRFLGSGTLEYDGETRCRVLYIAEDGTLRSTVFVSGFEDKVGSGELSEDCVEILTPVMRGLNVRLINPRKFNIRAQTGAVVEVYKRKCTMPELYGAVTRDDEDRLAAKVREFPSLNLTTLCENGLSLSEDLSFDAATPTAEELLFSRVTMQAEDCRLGAGEAQIRGVAQIVCICAAPTDAQGRRELVKISKDLTFTQTLKNKALHADGICDVLLTPENCEFRLREDEFGQKRLIEADVSYKCCLTVASPKTQRAVTDAFSLEKEVENDAGEMRFLQPVGALKGSFSVNETVDLDLPEDGGYFLEYCFCRPELAVTEEGGRAVLTGNCALSLLLRDSAGDLDARRASLPLRFVTDLRSGAGAEGRVTCRASNGRFRLDKNKLTCDFEVPFFGGAFCPDDLTVLESIRIQPTKRTLPGSRGSILLYYPDDGEEAFEIAKKYGVAPEAVERQVETAARPVLIERK